MGISPKDTHGPIVKTGPTAGKNRSRSKGGQWRRKRSDSGKPRKSGGSMCFLTTAACNSRGLLEDCYELEVLRDFRDNVLMASEDGRALVEHYYTVAPMILDHLTKRSDFDMIWSVVSECVTAIESENYESALFSYKTMVEDLENKYLLNITQTTFRSGFSI